MPFAEIKEDHDEKTPEDPMGNLMDMMKMLYSKGGDEMKKDIEKAWIKAENKYKGQ